MASQFINDTLKIAVGQICQTIGYQGIYSMPLDVLTDLLHRYMSEVCRLTHRYTEHFERSDSNLDDLGLAFLDMGISVPELEEYINNVDCPPFPHLLSSIPVSRTSNLNFLKPGAREILSRPIHIHEHLPPMYPEKEEEELEVKVGPALEEGMGESPSPAASPQPAIKRSGDSDASPSKRIKHSLVEEGQPVREILSVMMTTSGFISSAREGKLPEARCPNIPMATQRSSSPSVSGAAGKKKLNVEKLIRQKNSQGGSGRSILNKPPRPIKVKGKDKGSGKGLKMPGSKPPSLHKLGGPPSTLGFLTVPPKLKMPLPKVIVPKNSPKISTPKIHNPKPQASKLLPPKSAMPKLQVPKPPTPKIKVPKPPKTPKSETKKNSNPSGKDGEKDNDGKKVKKDKDQAKKSKEGKKEKDTTKKTKEPKKEKESKKEKDPKKEREGKKEKETKKEKEKEKERERELIIALASSPAVTITSIPTPGKAGPDLMGQEKAEGKSKLSIFKKINKSKDAKDQDRSGERDGQPSRDSSPDLMIDETPGRMGQRRPPEDLIGPDNHNRRLEMSVEITGMRSPGGFSSFQDDMSPPRTPTPRTPEIPHLPIRKTPEKRKGKEKGKDKRPRKDRSKSPKGGFSPDHRVPCDFEAPDRPKTPEVGLPLDDRGGPLASPFSLPPFPTAPGFIPPFSRFPFIPPFGGPPPRPCLPHSPMPDLRMAPHPFMPRPPSKRGLEDDHLVPLDEQENLERPLTPRHARDPSPLHTRDPSPLHTRDPSPLPGPSPSHSSPLPLRSPSPTHLAATPPRPRTPAHHSPPPPPLPRVKQEKVDKAEKEKKREHKKEKKEKEKEKEKIKKKKDKKDKGKEKEKSDKKEKKVKVKQEKRVKKEKEEGSGSSAPRITMKLASTTNPGQAGGALTDPPVTPKLVIKPVVKHDDDPPHKSQEDQPGSPEIAKFSALITRPPRSQQKRPESPQPLPVLKIKDMQNSSKKGDMGKVKEVPPLKIKNPIAAKALSNPKTTPSKGSSMPKQQQQHMSVKLPTSPKAMFTKLTPTPKVQDEKKFPGSKKARDKKEKKEKKIKELTQPNPMTTAGMIGGAGSKVGTPGGAGPDSSVFPPHPVVSNLPPPPDTPKSSKKQEQKSTGLLTETVGPIGHFVDDQGNEVWICPTCGKQDDGSPMIGCDTCDDWYHWVCVGIQVPPNDDVDWYCPRCLSQHKQRGAPPEKKKRGRKKK